jgi:hypothetical protein
VKYWGYFAVKVLAIAGCGEAGWWMLNRLLPPPPTVLGYRLGRFAQDLPWTSAILAVGFLCAGLLWLAVWDQQRRCRVCLRWLRMPVTDGDWGSASLFAPVETRSICPYGHGTLKEPEVHLTGMEATEWQRHEDDIWRELENLDSKR